MSRNAIYFIIFLHLLFLFIGLSNNESLMAPVKPRQGQKENILKSPRGFYTTNRYIEAIDVYASGQILSDELESPFLIEWYFDGVHEDLEDGPIGVKMAFWSNGKVIYNKGDRTTALYYETLINKETVLKIHHAMQRYLDNMPYVTNLCQWAVLEDPTDEGRRLLYIDANKKHTIITPYDINDNIADVHPRDKKFFVLMHNELLSFIKSSTYKRSDIQFSIHFPTDNEEPP